MTNSKSQSPRRYFVDEDGRRVLIGLTVEETSEFESLERQPSIGDPGGQVAWDGNGIPATWERRWLELYGKHERAWRQWMRRTSPDRLSLIS
jgi:hypothetical protein